MKYVAFYPGSSGTLIPDIVLANIINAAMRGKVTEAGKKLMLVPDKRHGQTDAAGLRAMRRVRKSECIPLQRIVPKPRCHAKAKSVPGNKGLQPARTPNQGLGARSDSEAISRDTCEQCGESISHMRKGTKYCSARCRKRASRP